jgi:hypothetical protein
MGFSLGTALKQHTETIGFNVYKAMSIKKLKLALYDV